MSKSVQKIRKEAQEFIKDIGEPIFPFPVADLAGLKGFEVKVFTPKRDRTYDISGVIDYAIMYPVVGVLCCGGGIDGINQKAAVRNRRGTMQYAVSNFNVI